MASESPKVRPLNKADLLEFYDTLPRASVRGIAAELNGETIAVAGVMMASPPLAFSYIRDELREYPKTILRMGRSFVNIMDYYDSVIYAEADPDEENAAAFLKWVGFEHVEGEVFAWVRQ